MSHEIRTPINAVLGMNEMVIRETRDDLIKAHAADLKSVAASLLSIVNNILDMSKIEEGKMILLLGQYDIRDMAEDVKNIVMPGAIEKGVLFVTRLDEKIPGSLFGDDLRLRQSLSNLLSAAVNKTREGAVTLSIDERERNEEEAVTLLTPESREFRNGVIVTSIRMAKGLEFDEVIIPGSSRDYDPSGFDRQLLYIACTRAMHELALV